MCRIHFAEKIKIFGQHFLQDKIAESVRLQESGRALKTLPQENMLAKDSLPPKLDCQNILTEHRPAAILVFYQNKTIITRPNVMVAGAEQTISSKIRARLNLYS